MTTRAPASLYAVYAGIDLPTKGLSGIVGDVAHQQRGGYHISDEDQSDRSNYSITLKRDREQTPDDEAAALDVRFTDQTQNTLAGERLRAAMAADDPRVDCIREIYYWNPDRGGTCGYDHPSHGPATTGQDHSGHVHISFYRDVVNDLDAIRGVIDVINGDGHSASGAGATPIQSEEDDMPLTDDDAKKVATEVVLQLRQLFAPGGELFGRVKQAVRSVLTLDASGPGFVLFDRFRQAVGTVMDRRDQAAEAKALADAETAKVDA